MKSGCACPAKASPTRNFLADGHPQAGITMSNHFPLGRQVGDFLTYILLPLVCVLLPYRWGQSLIRLVARRGWLLESRSELALHQAQRYVGVPDPATWMRHWRMVEMMEARDLWLCVMGRGGSISGRIQAEPFPAPETGLVLLGMHYGPTAIVLRMFRDAGLGPRFIYRNIEAELWKLVPFQWLYSKLNVRYIRQSCRGREITVPGARGKLEAALTEPGTPLILLDAPMARAGQSFLVQVLGVNTEFSGEGSQLLVDRGARCVYYWMEVSDTGERLLRFMPSSRPPTAELLIQEFADQLSARLQHNSAHWRLWHAADQFFRSERRKD